MLFRDIALRDYSPTCIQMVTAATVERGWAREVSRCDRTLITSHKLIVAWSLAGAYVVGDALQAGMRFVIVPQDCTCGYLRPSKLVSDEMHTPRLARWQTRWCDTQILNIRCALCRCYVPAIWRASSWLVDANGFVRAPAFGVGFAPIPRRYELFVLKAS